jgi:site-specific recombinase XerC
MTDAEINFLASLLSWQMRRRITVDDYAFPSWSNQTSHLSTRQYARLVDEWVSPVALRKDEYGTHSPRRTKASIIYKSTGNLRAIQLFLGHTKFENTVRYLGVDVEGALALAEGTEVGMTLPWHLRPKGSLCIPQSLWVAVKFRHR